MTMQIDSALRTAMNASGKTEFTRAEVIELAQRVNVSPQPILTNSQFRVRHGVYSISGEATSTNISTKASSLVPVKDPTFVAFGHYADLRKIISANMFFPVYIVGMSGNGKTTMVEQACASLKREAIRVNISIETDEDDLIGGHTLIDGNVVFREGPVLTALRRGAVLILDEIDRGSNKLMCLQSILEGKPYFNKKTQELIHPAPGFNIVATANTKGFGVDDTRYISAQILDDAFLERFAVAFQQEYPPMNTENLIVLRKMKKTGVVDEDFAGKLVTWSDVIRRSYADGAVEDIITTRRLEHIVNAFAVFQSREKASNMSIARFDDNTKKAFFDLYTKVDPDWQKPYVHPDMSELDVINSVLSVNSST